MHKLKKKIERGQPGRKNKALAHAVHYVEVTELGKPCRWKNERQFKKQVPKPEVLEQARRELGLVN